MSHSTTLGSRPIPLIARGVMAFGLALLTSVSGCDAPDDAAADDDLFVGGKADNILGLEEGSAEAKAILKLANEATFETLDDDVRLDRRAARNIVDARGVAELETLEKLDEVPFVGRSAFTRMLEFVHDNGLADERRTLRISTLNIRWFGLNGDLFGSLGTETRVDSAREFIEQHLSDRDVLVFQEIVDQELFFEQVVPDLICTSYDASNPKHQHIAVCHTDEFEFRLAPDDDNHTIEEINTNGFLRPAVHGTLHTAGGDPVAELIAVHLKANEQSTARRVVQAEILADRIGKLETESELPIIITGDFNTHFAVDTGLADNDEDILQDILLPLVRVALPVTFTYQEPNGKTRRLDHAFVSPEVSVLNVESAGACDLDINTHQAEIQRYFDTLSDHCPVMVDLSLPPL